MASSKLANSSFGTSKKKKKVAQNTSAKLRIIKYLKLLQLTSSQLQTAACNNFFSVLESISKTKKYVMLTYISLVNLIRQMQRTKKQNVEKDTTAVRKKIIENVTNSGLQERLIFLSTLYTRTSYLVRASESLFSYHF